MILPSGHIGWPVEYDGESGCTPFAEETGGARRGGRAIVAKPALLSGALDTFSEFSDTRGRASPSDCDRQSLSAAIDDSR
jgi:hypothetical protein